MRSTRMLAIVACAVAVAGLAPAAPAAASAQGGMMQWKATFSAKTRSVSGNATAVSPDGKVVFVTGTASGPGDLSFGETIAYHAATGAVMWKATYPPDPDSDTGGFASIAVSPDGSAVFVAGSTGTGVPGPVLVAYNAATGAKLWKVTKPVNTCGIRSRVAVSPDSSAVFVTCADVGTTGQTAAFSAATGARLWTEPGGGDAIAVAAGGAALFVTGEPDSSGHAGTQAFSAGTGATMWRADDTGQTSLAAAGLSPDGTVLFVSGIHGSGTTTAAYSTESGTQLWAALFARTGTVDGVAETSTGSTVIVSEWLTKSWLTLALAPQTGKTVWTRTGGITSGLVASGLVLSPDGSTAYVTGYGPATGNGSHDLTIAYNTATGAKVWAARYAGLLENFAYAIAVSPNGSQVFITGASNNGPTTQDIMTTIAYRA